MVPFSIQNLREGSRGQLGQLGKTKSHITMNSAGIQVLRDNDFSPDTMIRRAPEGDDEGSAEGASEIARWSSHRVMQWLKQIDLAEYAPNLRGAGMYLTVYGIEPRIECVDPKQKQKQTK